MPKNSAAPPLAKRKPVLTSSKISRIPNSSVSARIAWWKPGLGMIPWALPSTGSTMIAAISSPLALEQAAQEVDVVVAGRDDRLGDRVRDAPAPAQRDRVLLVAQLAHVVGPDADQRVVVDAVVLALELHDLVATGEGARDPHRVHRRLGAGHRHPGLRDPRVELLDELHRPDLVLAGEREADAEPHPLVDVVVDALVAVAEDHRPVAHAQVDELVAVDVPDPSALAAVDVDRVVAPGAEVRVGAARQRPRARRYIASWRARESAGTDRAAGSAVMLPPGYGSRQPPGGRRRTSTNGDAGARSEARLTERALRAAERLGPIVP